MARARNIKPGFFKNEDLVELPFEYRLLFAGLWTLADREGRVEDRPKRIKMELFPADNVDVDHGLGELARYGFVELYEACGVRVVVITKFAEHQRPHPTEKASELPGKDDACISEKHDTTPAQGAVSGSDNSEPQLDNRQSHEKKLENIGNPPSLLNPSLLNPSLLNPDSLNPTTGTSPVVPRAQAHATPTAAPPVQTEEKPEGLAKPEKPEPAPEAEPAKPDKPPKAGRKTERGSRLPDDWQLPKTWGDWALGKRPDMNADDVRREAECFANFWHAKPGQNARKLDWEATWHNWILRVDSKPRALPHARASPRANGVLAASIPPDMEQAFAIAEENLFGVIIDEPV